jgi:uncharacterized SAM-dependent methyltransferase
MRHKERVFQAAYINFSESTGEFDNQFLACLQQRKIGADFTFWGRDAAQAWTNMLYTPEYKINSSEKNILEDNLPKIIKHLGKDDLNCISLCCGILDREKYLLSQLAADRRLTYVPIDSSIDIINASLKSISSISNIDILPFISTLKSLPRIVGATRRMHHNSSLLTMFCNVIGNYPQVPLLSNIHESMTEQDHFLLGVQLISEDFENKDIKARNDEVKSILTTYNNDRYLDFLYQFIYRAGFKKEDGYFEIEFANDRLYPALLTVEVYFCLSADKKIQYLGEEIIYRKGERIQIRFSYIYTLSGIENMLQENGFKLVDKFLSNKKGFALILCKK